MRASQERSSTKRSPTEVIESTPFPHIEHAFTKLPGQPIEDISNFNSTETQCIHHPVKIGKQYVHIHTHPTALPKHKRSWIDRLLPGLFHPESRYAERQEIDFGALPSPKDMRLFLQDARQKTAIIAVREPESGKIRGYTLVRKTPQTPRKPRTLHQDIRTYRTGYQTIEKMHDAFQSLLDKHRLQSKFLIVPGYRLNDTKTQFVTKKA